MVLTRWAVGCANLSERGAAGVSPRSLIRESKPSHLQQTWLPCAAPVQRCVVRVRESLKTAFAQDEEWHSQLLSSTYRFVSHEKLRMDITWPSETQITINSQLPVTPLWGITPGFRGPNTSWGYQGGPRNSNKRIKDLRVVCSVLEKASVWHCPSLLK